MKKKIIGLTVSLLLIGVNVFAQGDLVVNGKLGLGANPNGSKLNISAIDSGSGIWSDVRETANTSDNLQSVIGFLRLKGSGGVGGATEKVAQKFTIRLEPSGDYNFGNLIGQGILVHGLGGGAGNDMTFTNVTGIDIAHSWNDAGYSFFNATNYTGVAIGNIASLGNFGLGTITNAVGIKVDKQTYGTKKIGIWLNGEEDGADIVFGSTINKARIYAKAETEGNLAPVGLFAEDSLGNSTQISPHDPETGDWIYYSKNIKTGRTVRVNMEKLVKAVEKITGEKFLVETFETVD